MRFEEVVLDCLVLLADVAVRCWFLVLGGVACCMLLWCAVACYLVFVVWRWLLHIVFCHLCAVVRCVMLLVGRCDCCCLLCIACCLVFGARCALRCAVGVDVA